MNPPPERRVDWQQHPGVGQQRLCSLRPNCTMELFSLRAPTVVKDLLSNGIGQWNWKDVLFLPCEIEVYGWPD